MICNTLQQLIWASGRLPSSFQHIQSQAESGESVFGRDYEVRNNQSPVIFGGGNQTRDFVYIEDVVKAIFNTMENKKALGEIFNIGTGIPTGIKELAGMIIKVCDKKLAPEFAPGLKGDIRESYADITKAKKLLDYQP